MEHLAYSTGYSEILSDFIFLVIYLLLKTLISDCPTTIDGWTIVIYRLITCVFSYSTSRKLLNVVEVNTKIWEQVLWILGTSRKDELHDWESSMKDIWRKLTFSLSGFTECPILTRVAVFNLYMTSRRRMRRNMTSVSNLDLP